MKLIIEKSDRIYIYREDKDHFKHAEKCREDRGLKKIDFIFDEECDTNYMPDNTYIVLKIKNE